MTTIAVEKVQAELPKLLEQLTPGDEIVIVRDEKPIGKIVGIDEFPIGVPIPGRGKGRLEIISEDDDHLRDFEEYMS